MPQQACVEAVAGKDLHQRLLAKPLDQSQTTRDHHSCQFEIKVTTQMHPASAAWQDIAPGTGERLVSQLEGTY